MRDQKIPVAEYRPSRENRQEQHVVGECERINLHIRVVNEIENVDQLEHREGDAGADKQKGRLYAEAVQTAEEKGNRGPQGKQREQQPAPPFFQQPCASRPQQDICDIKTAQPAADAKQYGQGQRRKNGGEHPRRAIAPQRPRQKGERRKN